MEYVRTGLYIIAAVALAQALSPYFRRVPYLALGVCLFGLSLVSTACATCRTFTLTVDLAIWILGLTLVTLQAVSFCIGNPGAVLSFLVKAGPFLASATQAVILVAFAKTCTGCLLFLLGQLILAFSQRAQSVQLAPSKVQKRFSATWLILLVVSATGFRFKDPETRDFDPSSLLNLEFRRVFPSVHISPSTTASLFLVTIKGCEPCNDAKSTLTRLKYAFREVPYCGFLVSDQCADPNILPGAVAPVFFIVYKDRIVGVRLGLGEEADLKKFLSTAGIGRSI